ARGYAAPTIALIGALHLAVWILRSPARHATAWLVLALPVVTAVFMLCTAATTLAGVPCSPSVPCCVLHCSGSCARRRTGSSRAFLPCSAGRCSPSPSSEGGRPS